jgi:hypothetical protein
MLLKSNLLAHGWLELYLCCVQSNHIDVQFAIDLQL